MIVVLVFMLGLGFGAIVAGQKIQRFKHPIFAFAVIEILLLPVNLTIAWIFALDLSETVYSVQQFTVSAGLPLRLVYGVGALLMLAIPTLLMGATIPIASEAVQRDLHFSKNKTITFLFFLNTGGAALGALGAGFFLLPYYGQTTALIFAAGCNLISALLLVSISWSISAITVNVNQQLKVQFKPIIWEEKLAFLLGFLALGYEMYCFRLMSLAHGPLPYTFAVTLCLYLLIWSLGVYLASFTKERFLIYFFSVCLLMILMPKLYYLDRFQWELNYFVAAAIYCSPCIFFGLLYGHLVSRSAKHWGSDVGRFYAINTIGSCLGVIFFTVLGYELSLTKNSFVIFLCLIFIVILYLISASKKLPQKIRWGGFGFQGLIVLAIVMITLDGLRQPYTVEKNGFAFWGRDGVVEIDHRGNVYLDSLWHTKLTDGKSHIGGPWSWAMAVAGVLAHQTGEIKNALVIGFGVGLTGTTLALKKDLQVDGYEINHTLKDVLRQFPKETLYVTRNRKINIIWQDARSGLAVNSKKYDLIISAPLELSQAGSTLLLSREYFHLVKSRLKENGVVVLYSRESSIKQTQLVRNTVSSVFQHTQTIAKGIITLASDSPIHLSQKEIQTRLSENSSDPFYREIATFDRDNPGNLDNGFRSIPSLPIGKNLTISDKYPLVEYPDVVEKLVTIQ